MKTQFYKQLSLGCFVAGNVATAGAIGTWIAGRLTRRDDLAHDGLFLGVIGTAFYSLGNRLAVASLDHAERVRFTGEDGETPEAGIGMATTFQGERLPQATPGIAVDETKTQSPRPLSHVRHGASL